MEYQVLYTDAALEDLDEIVAYSWVNFPATAERFGVALLNHIELLKSFPEIGSPVPDRAGVRQLVHTPIVIYYFVNRQEKRVEILNLWHGAQDRRARKDD